MPNVTLIMLGGSIPDIDFVDNARAVPGNSTIIHTNKETGEERYYVQKYRSAADACELRSEHCRMFDNVIYINLRETPDPSNVAAVMMLCKKKCFIVYSIHISRSALIDVLYYMPPNTRIVFCYTVQDIKNLILW